MSRITITGPAQPGFDTILTAAALDFVAALHDEFARDLVTAAAGPAGVLDADTGHGVLEQAAAVAQAAERSQQPTSITAPPLGAQAVEACESGAEVWLADLGLGMTPRFENVITAQLNLAATIRGKQTVIDPRGGIRLHVRGEHTPTIAIRPRGPRETEMHLHYTADNGHTRPANGALVDFGLFFFHNAGRLELAGERPRVVLGDVTADVARWWNRVFAFASEYRGFDDGTIAATVQIDSPTTALDIDEIEAALGEHWEGMVAAPVEYETAVLARRQDDAAAVELSTTAEVRAELRSSLDHLAAWLRGMAEPHAVAATEGARARLWLAVRHRTRLDGQTELSADVMRRMIAEELAVTMRDHCDYYDEAAELLAAAVLAPTFEPVLFSRAYAALLVDRHALSGLRAAA